VFLSLLLYVGLGAGARALVPVYGQALVVAYWGLSILALLYLVGSLRRRLLHDSPSIVKSPHAEVHQLAASGANAPT